jgi:hypothetical protein
MGKIIKDIIRAKEIYIGIYSKLDAWKRCNRIFGLVGNAS